MTGLCLEQKTTNHQKAEFVKAKINKTSDTKQFVNIVHHMST